MEDCLKKNRQLRDQLGILYDEAEDRRMCRNWLQYFIRATFTQPKK